MATDDPARRPSTPEEPRAPARLSPDGYRRHLEFPAPQTHRKSFEAAMVIISIICVIVVVVIVLFTNIGNEFRPTV